MKHPLLVWAVEPVSWQRRAQLALQSLMPWKYELRAFSLSNPDQRVKGWITKDGAWIVTRRTLRRRGARNT